MAAPTDSTPRVHVQMPKVPALNLGKLTADAGDPPYSHELDASRRTPGAGGPATPSPRVKHVTRQYSTGSIASGRGLSGKLMSGIAAMSPRRKESPRSVMTTPRGALDQAQYARGSGSGSLPGGPAPALDPVAAASGPLEMASRQPPSGMNRAQLEGELLRARTDLMYSRKVRELPREYTAVARVHCRQSTRSLGP